MEEQRILTPAQLDDYRRAMAAQYEADAKEADETFLREREAWKRIRQAATQRRLRFDGRPEE